MSDWLFEHLGSRIIHHDSQYDWSLFYIFGDIAWLSWSYQKRFENDPAQWSANGIAIINSYSIFMHILTSFIMWIIGFYQFRISIKASKLHKYCGWMYLFCAIISSMTGIILSIHHKFNMLSQYILITGSIHISL